VSAAKYLISRLNEAIELKKLRKVDIKNATGFSSSLLEAYLTGASTPGMDAAEKLAQVLGLSLGEALRGAPAQPPRKPSPLEALEIVKDALIEREAHRSALPGPEGVAALTEEFEKIPKPEKRATRSKP
jgi:transcriptional regulator with XRE-family HTH domain